MFKDKNLAKIKELEKKTSDYLNGWKRAQADYQNLQKRTLQDQQEFVKYANENIILDFIPVLDNLESAYGAMPKELAKNAWTQGIKFIKKQLEDALKKNGIEEIEAKIGQKFNPEFHEAVKSDKKASDQITKIILKGYKLNGKVIRPAKVEI